MLRIAGLGFVVVVLCSAQEGTRVFIGRCIQCHDQNSDAHAPLPEALAGMPWENILNSGYSSMPGSVLLAFSTR